MNRMKASPIIIQVAAWLLFMSFPLLFMNQGQSVNPITGARIFGYLQFCLLYISLFYLHAYWIVPHFLLKRRYTGYALLLVLLLGAVYFIRPFDRMMSSNRSPQTASWRPPMPPHGSFGPSPDGRMKEFQPGFKKFDNKRFDITSIFIFIMVMGLGAAMQSFRQWQLSEKRALEAENDKANAELSFLKAQINPHFLYNTLNNIYTLCIMQSENAAESVMKLSNIMRYVTDESEADFVSLADEVDCISNFIDLQKLRLGKMVTLNYTIEGDLTGYRITPLIFMTFVENVFKYGLSNHLASQIDIVIKAEDKLITFYSKNQVFGHKKPQERTGVGLENTKKRLAYLYPGTHKLEIIATDQFFSVQLELMS